MEDANTALGRFSCRGRARHSVSKRGLIRKRFGKDVVRLKKELERLKSLLAAARIDVRKRVTITSLRPQNWALKAEIRSLRETIAALEARIERLESIRTNMARKTFGKGSEKKTPSRRKGCQPPGSRGHGRVPRSYMRGRWSGMSEESCLVRPAASPACAMGRAARTVPNSLCSCWDGNSIVPKFS